MREDVVGGEFEATREAVLQLDREAVVDGAVVGAEERNRRRVDRNAETGRVFIAAVLVHALLVLIRNIQAPVVGESVFVSGARGQRIRSVIVRIDEGAQPR